jgi:dCMP deaminase
MPKQNALDETYLRMAETWAQLSKARRKKVGCLIVKNGAIISDGYNGTPRGFNNNCEIEVPRTDVFPHIVVDDDGNFVEGTYNLITKPEVLHAESNAITKLAKSTQSSEDSTMYITISPCVDCSKLIIQSGIKRVVFGELYRNDKGIKLLKKANIRVDNVEVREDKA